MLYHHLVRFFWFCGGFCFRGGNSCLIHISTPAHVLLGKVAWLSIWILFNCHCSSSSTSLNTYVSCVFWFYIWLVLRCDGGTGKNGWLFCRSCDRLLLQSGARQAHNSLPPGRDICGPQARLGHTTSKTRKKDCTLEGKLASSASAAIAAMSSSRSKEAMVCLLQV